MQAAECVDMAAACREARKADDARDERQTGWENELHGKPPCYPLA
ncbi:hypothetical protein BMAPRL20_A0842 [Burkholderia mallei PRL-20]|nr:hypothetical protein BMA10247_0636 [Burkholderia mallei NCTC 10247]EEP86411.1 conserved hypothetical protein [Burkholderia mallei GB8 horse 4]EES44443.1 hypothetical protein BMAPRL20_A0842 [Burkholderia mallei PRL-20]